jgi:hypothetical protein
LLIFLLKGLMPEKYAERQRVSLLGNIDIAGEIAAARETAK